VALLVKIFENVIENPEEQKYRSFKADRVVPRLIVSGISGVNQFALVMLLEYAGFSKSSHTVSESTSDSYVLPQDASLTALKESLQYLKEQLSAEASPASETKQSSTPSKQSTPSGSSSKSVGANTKGEASESEAPIVTDDDSHAEYEIALDKIETWTRSLSTIIAFLTRFPEANMLRRMCKDEELALLPSKASELVPMCECSAELNDRVSLWCGDIARLRIDAIVNSAHPGLMGGGGVDGHIHQAAGDRLMEECRLLNGCEPGDAKITKGYSLPARFVIHTVGPTNRTSGGADLLASCYEKCLALAVRHRLRSLAFVCISTGSYEFPFVQAAHIGLKTVRSWLEKQKASDIDRIIFCVRTARDEVCYQTLMPLYFPSPPASKKPTASRSATEQSPTGAKSAKS